LLGHRPEDALLRAAAGAELADARPLPGNAFKLGLITDLVAATVRDLVTGADPAAGGHGEEQS
ncbi:hypothetical protein GTY57_20060, partial [Streptomyces sp. SID5475]|nr:hypothetical protein [Streptomyces sp. SID5475]